MTLRSDKASKGFEHRESFMFHRIDIQRLSGKKSKILHDGMGKGCGNFVLYMWTECK